MKIIKKVACMFFVVAIILTSSTGCNSNAVSQNNEYPVSIEYYITCENGQYFFDIDDRYKGINIYENPSDYLTSMMAGLFFSSPEELCEVTEGSLTAYEAIKIWQENRNEKTGKAPICDLYNLKYPKTPETPEWKQVWWLGNCYQLSFACDTYIGAFIYYGSKTEYSRNFNDYYCYYSEESYDKVYDEERDITTYENDEERFVLYSIEDTNKILHVKETYDFEKSKTVPESVKIYGEQGEERFEIDILKLTEAPTKEWLLKFGVEK